MREKQRYILDENQLNRAKKFVQDHFVEIPATAIILGSGLGVFAEALTDRKTLRTAEIPGYPISTVEGHLGRWVVGTCDSIPILAVQGRIHGYEGYRHDQIAFPIHLLAEFGVQTLIITNAAGAINRFYAPGQFMVIADHINLSFDNPLFGPNTHQYGPRFPDMYAVYDPQYIQIAIEEGLHLRLPVAKGVYWGVSGPSYETAAEIRMGERIGADAVGMSTIAEVIAAAYHGMRVLGISCISNMSTGISTNALSHAEVTEVAERVKNDFLQWITMIVKRISRKET